MSGNKATLEEILKLENIPEIILVDKPYGFSSFDVIRILRKKLNIRKIGHGGTLDPLATGLMVIGLGKGTKQLEKLIKLDKVYDTEILLGVKTDSGDLEGNVVENTKVEHINSEKLNQAIDSCIGILSLPVPNFSAIKIDGKRLYDLARAGNTKIISPTRDMQIFDANLLDFYPVDDHYTIKIQMHISSGSYVRSIAEEIGNRLGVPATVANLRRTKIGEFTIQDAYDLGMSEVGRIKKRSER